MLGSTKARGGKDVQSGKLRDGPGQEQPEPRRTRPAGPRRRPGRTRDGSYRDEGCSGRMRRHLRPGGTRAGPQPERGALGIPPHVPRRSARSLGRTTAALTAPRSRLHRPAARTAARSGDRRRPRPGTARPRPLRGQGAGLASAAANGERSGAGSVGAAGAGRCGGGGASSGLLLLQGGEPGDLGTPSAHRPLESPPVA